jgi:hypothetical protein
LTISWGGTEAILKQCIDTPVHVLLVSCEKLWGFPGKVYYQKAPHQRDCTALAQQLGSPEGIATLIGATAGGDYNQVRVLHTLLSVLPADCAAAETFVKDSAPHVYFDTLKLLRGVVSVPDDSVNVDWIPQPSVMSENSGYPLWS